MIVGLGSKNSMFNTRNQFDSHPQYWSQQIIDGELLRSLLFIASFLPTAHLIIGKVARKVT